MAVNIATHLPIIVVQTRSGNQESIKHYNEKAGQTFKTGTPVELDGSGLVIPWDGTTVLRAILGISMLPALNLATDGAGASPLFGSIGLPGGVTYSTVVNEPSANNILGGPFFDGTSMVAQAIQDTVFSAMVDDSAGTAYAATIANVGHQYGLTVDANGQWYVDLGKDTVGTNTVVTIVSLDPLYLVAGSTTTQVANGLVRFTFNTSATQVQA